MSKHSKKIKHKQRKRLQKKRQAIRQSMQEKGASQTAIQQAIEDFNLNHDPNYKEKRKELEAKQWEEKRAFHIAEQQRILQERENQSPVDFTLEKEDYFFYGLYGLAMLGILFAFIFMLWSTSLEFTHSLIAPWIIALVYISVIAMTFILPQYSPRHRPISLNYSDGNEPKGFNLKDMDWITKGSLAILIIAGLLILAKPMYYSIHDVVVGKQYLRLQQGDYIIKNCSEETYIYFRKRCVYYNPLDIYLPLKKVNRITEIDHIDIIYYPKTRKIDSYAILLKDGSVS